MKAQQFKKIILFIMTIGLISCSFTNLPTEVKQSIKETDKNIEVANKKLTKSQNKINNNFNYEMDTIYISDVIVQRKETDFLPAKFNNSVQMDGGFTSMQQIADALNRLTKYPVLVDMDSSSNNVRDFYVRITQHSGSLVELLNNLAAKTDTTWNFREGKIILSDTETKTWPIHGIAGNIQVQNQVNSNSGIQSGGGNSSGGGGQTSGSQNTVQNIQFNMTNSLWDSIQVSIKSMLSRKGSLSINAATSSITVTDKPSIILRVNNFIKQQNDILKRQVQIDVQVLAVQTKAEDDYGINWGLAFKGANATFNINGVAGGADGGGVAQVFSPSSTTQAFTFGVPNNAGDLSGSKLIIQALSKIAKTSMITSVAATTLNNQPVPVQLVEQQSYLAGSTTVVPANGQPPIITLQPGQVTSGFVLNILPVIEANGLVNLQVSLNLSDLKQMDKISSNNQTIQLPNMIQRNTMQKTTVRSGDTYVITGFDRVDDSITNTGVGGAYNWLFGGGVSARKAKSKLVILVTPRIVNI